MVECECVLAIFSLEVKKGEGNFFGCFFWEDVRELQVISSQKVKVVPVANAPLLCPIYVNVILVLNH